MGDSTALPSGTVTFLFTDVSTTPVVTDEANDIAAEALRSEAADRNGHSVRGSHDSLAFVFARAVDAVHAAVQMQLRVTAGNRLVRIRVGLHTGEAEARDGGYAGAAVTRVARLTSSARGGQILASAATANVLADSDLSGIEFVNLGQHRLRGLSRTMTVGRAPTLDGEIAAAHLVGADIPTRLRRLPNAESPV